MVYMMLMDRAADGCVTWHTGDVSLIPNFINQTTLDKSWIPLAYENLLKTFCCCLYYSLSLSLDTSLSLSLSHDVDFCDVIKKPGGGCYVIFSLFKAFRPRKLGIRLMSPVCHVIHPSAAWSIIINPDIRTKNMVFLRQVCSWNQFEKLYLVQYYWSY